MVLNPQQFHMELLHGTTSNYEDHIKAAGLGGQHGFSPSVYATHDPALAHYYADTAADQEGGEPIIIKFKANPRNLRADYNSFEEPVVAEPYGAPYRSFDESKLRSSGDWKNSLRETGSVVHQGKIEPNKIVSIEKVKRNFKGG